MSQTDLDIANASGATVRADMNAHLDALVTQSSGATAPTTTFPNQWWFDSSTNILKQRDNANTAWVNAFLKSGTGWIPYRNGVLLGDAAVQTIGVAATTNVANIEDLQQATFAAVLATGTADVITLAYTPTIASINTFQPFTFEAVSNNTGSVTINVDGTGAKTAKKNGGADNLEADDFVAGGIYTGVYDGTVIQIIAGLRHGGITLRAEQATTSGTFKEETAIPSGTRRVTLMLASVSTTGTSALMVQIGDSGGVETSGYVSDSTDHDVSGHADLGSVTAGMNLSNASAAASVWSGKIVLELQDSVNNVWLMTGHVFDTNSNQNGSTSISLKGLTGVLDQVRLTTVGGSDSFDSGAMSVSFE